MKFNIRLLYLYLFSFIGLLIIVIGTINLVDLGLRTYIFTESDYVYYSTPETNVDPQLEEQRFKADQKSQKQRQLSNAIAMIMVGTPLYIYHWRLIKKEGK